MTDIKRPDWTKTAKPIEQVQHIDRWYKPEYGTLDGRLVSQGDQENRFRPGEVSRVFVIQEVGSSDFFGVTERPAFVTLRATKLGSRVCILPTGSKEVSDSKGGTFKRWEFEVYIDETPAPAEPDPTPGSPLPF